MKRVAARARAAALFLMVCALLLPAGRLRADGEAVDPALRKALLAATVRAIELEIQATRLKLESAEQGVGPEENIGRFREKIRELEAERGRFAGLKPEDYPEPVQASSDPAPVLDGSLAVGPVLPPVIRQAVL
ncbi:MAG: hypothetical protein JW820_08120, partial [Spirochaetales bacterium]|nr:hypothetical protein [Spirochaetales bacterium]